jgi:hypothetical protein
MLENKMIELLHKGLQRVFALPITRSTFRELQTVIITSVNQNTDLASDVFEAFFTGKVKKELVEGEKGLKKVSILIQQYGILARLSKEVYERGEFVNIITSDTLNQDDKTVFLNRVRRIDGQEFQFITDPESTIHLLHHFANRLQEMRQSDNSANALENYSKELASLREKIEEAVTV